jgi:hypothetical protein
VIYEVRSGQDAHAGGHQNSFKASHALPNAQGERMIGVQGIVCTMNFAQRPSVSWADGGTNRRPATAANLFAKQIA